MSHPNKPTYWRSLGELADTPEFRAQLEAEFPVEETSAGFSRRRMLQLMGASMVLAAAGSCRWKEREALPFNKRPENFTPGKFERYATAMELGGSVLGLLVTCVDGRPIKVEGNPKHPNSLGATNAYAQAAILELYDPDRSRHIIEKTPEGDMVRSWEQFSEFAKKHFEEYRKNGGEGLAILADRTLSPTIDDLKRQLLAEYSKAQWCSYESVETQDSVAMSDLSDAEIIVSLDSDLFGTHPRSIELSRNFAKSRDARNGKMSRLYVAESRYTITGAMADHRLPMKSSEIAKLPSLILLGIDNEKELSKFKNEFSPHAFEFIKAMIGDIKKHLNKCFVAIDGQTLILDESVESVNGHTREFHVFSRHNTRFHDIKADDSSDDNARPTSKLSDIAALKASVEKGRIHTLLILGCNPLYDLPADLELASELTKVSTTIHLSRYRNETSQACSWHVPQSHFLESWGDLVEDGLHYCIQQPMIEPLHQSKSTIEMLLALLPTQNLSPLEKIKTKFKDNAAVADAEVEKRWRETIHDGFIIKERASFVTNEFDITAIDATTDPWVAKIGSASSKEEKIPLAERSVENGNLEITFRPSPAVYDGRFANLSWLQEMPDPITRLTWDNVALISPATAEKLGVKHEEIVKLKFKGREIEIPAYILPGQADGSVAVTLGYGRTAAGKVGGSEKDGVAPVGVNTYKLRTSDAMYYGVGLTVEPTGRMHPLASVAEHFAIDIDSIAKKGAAERVPELVREMTVEEYRKKAETGEHKNSESTQPSPPAPLPKGEGSHEAESLWEEHKYEGHCWGLTVDLSKCVGCGACVVACMAENNVPVVGKERIFKNREMHWLRIDRYFRGDTSNPQIVFQPVMCQQCEMAPCEGVCPVGATAHSQEGLNDMVYNRCVGTRYCANNCPYKVRRFNFFNYHKQYEDPANEVLKMASNPQVTVRMRGVMEKCTYCVQRIQAAKIEAKNAKRTLADGEIKTACQQVCPAGAIIFGDLNDKNSAVSRSLADSRSYQMLGELNTKPRTSYLARIRNPNPELEK